MTRLRTGLAALRRARAAESGSATIEFVLWLPVIMLVAMLVFESTMAFLRQADDFRIASQFARGLTTGQIAPAAAVELARERHGRELTIRTRSGLVEVELSAPFSQIGTGFLAPFGTMRVSVISRIEPHVRLPA